MMAQEELEQFIAEMGLTMTTEFVPWSKSKRKDEKEPSLNWKVTILRNGKELLTINYTAGMGHCPHYKKRREFIFKKTIYNMDIITRECETGREAIGLSNLGPKIEPKLTDVLYCLANDASVLDYKSFEDWAESYGYDPDSRIAEKIYNECLKTGLALRNGLGENNLQALQEAAQDY